MIGAVTPGRPSSQRSATWAAEHLLRAAAVVHVRGVDEGAARLGERVENAVGGRFVARPGERHGAQAQFADLESAPAEKSLLHGTDHTR